METDYISRQWLLDEYDKRHKGPPGGARKMIEEAPPVDVRPVVTCRDCRYYEKFREGEGDAFYGWCDTHNICVRNNFFCADGERREGGTP